MTDLKDRVRSSFRGGETKRALLASAAGAALGLIAALFARDRTRVER